MRVRCIHSLRMFIISELVTNNTRKMFKFDFSSTDTVKDKNNDQTNISLSWNPAYEVKASAEQFNKKYESDDFVENKYFCDVTLKLIHTDRVLVNINDENYKNIIEAESQHSDLVPAKYEGGLKIWECSYDLGNYLLEHEVPLENKVALDLGCGVGLIGLTALLKGSIVHFQDYNVEVIKLVTIPNVLLNVNDRSIVDKRCEFYCGDWESFTSLCSNKYDEDKKYDLIFTSETIYNSDNHRKLYEVFKQRLKSNGTGYVAGKTYYFGVGGSMRQFENLIREDGVFDVEVVWKSKQGLQREILRLTKKNLASFTK